MFFFSPEADVAFTYHFGSLARSINLGMDFCGARGLLLSLFYQQNGQVHPVYVNSATPVQALLDPN